MSSQAPDTMDQTALLVNLCVKVLKRVSPKGMTTKELAAALDHEQTDGFNGISSSILSSKLNAVFRRVHIDSPRPSQKQLSSLPMTRNPSTDVPRRLVYRYTPPDPSYANDELISSDESDDGSSGDEQSEPRTPRDSSDSEDIDKLRKRKHSFDTVASSPQKRLKTQSEAGAKKTSNAERSSDLDSGSSSDQKGDKRNKDVQPIQRRPYVSMQLRYTPPKVNLYYDMIGFDALTLALNEKIPEKAPGPRHEEPVRLLHGDWDFQAPESLPLNDLDNSVI